MTRTDELRLRSATADGAEGGGSPPFSRWLVPLAFVVFATCMAVFSAGFLEPDEVTHFLKARDIWRDWRSLTDIWGRFGANGLYGLAAPFGVTAARLVAVAITALTGWATVIIARYFLAARGLQQSPIVRHSAAFAWLLLFAQPCFALNCFTVMTEMLLACSWAWAVAVLILLRDKPVRGILLSALVLGLGGLMRPEGWIAIAAWPVFAAVWLKRDVKENPGRKISRRVVLPASVILAGLPTLTWFLLGALANHDGRWVVRDWAWAVKSQYGQSGREFILSAIFSMAIWLWAPVIIGICSLWFKDRDPRDTARDARNRRDARICLVAPLVGLYLMNGVLSSFGLFGSMSLPRYFIPAAPMAAVLALRGLAMVERKVATALAVLFRGAVIAGALSTPAFLALVFHWLPMPASAEMRRLDIVAQEIQKRLPKSEIPQRLIIGNPYSVLALDLPLSCPSTNRVFSRQAMAEAPLGTMLITDSTMWCYEGRPKPEELTAWGYRMDEEVAAKVDAMTMQVEPWSIGWPPMKIGPWAIGWSPGKVRLWVKQEEAAEGNAGDRARGP